MRLVTSSRARRAGIRAATTDDAQHIAELGAAAFVAAFGPSNDPVAVADYVASAFSIDTIAAQLADPGARWLVAQDGPRLVGMAHLQGGPAPKEVDAEHPVQLSRLYTRPDVTSVGIGSRLMQAALENAAGVGHDLMWLGVWEHNPGAIRFYRRFGFSEVGSVVFRLGGDDQTDLLYVRALRPASGGSPIG